MARYEADAAWETRHTPPASGPRAPRRPYPWVLGVTASPASEENQVGSLATPSYQCNATVFLPVDSLLARLLAA